MKKERFLSIITSLLIFSSGAYAQHEGHGTVTTVDEKKQVSEVTEQKMGMIYRDRKFIEHMISHHRDAIDMAKLAAEKSKRDEIKKLSADIIRTQTSEIDMMKKWYKEWYNTDVPEMAAGKVGMMGSGEGMMGRGMMMDMRGEMSSGMMKMNPDDLKKAPDFDRAFIEMMVKHHAGAVMMSGMVIDSKRSEMRKLGRDIITAQSSEIEQMIQWYIKWYGKW